MQPNQQGKRSGGGGNGQQQNQDQFRSQPIQRQVQNQVIDNINERIDSLIYGYLRRNGYDEAADALERESENIPQPLNRSNSQGPSMTFVNDRLHDLHLEQIITLFHRDGRFGMNQNMLDFGEDLRRLTDRFSTITANADIVNRSYVQQQLYRHSGYSRNQQPQIYTIRPAPQAIAQMQLQQINQMAEIRYREQQRAKVDSELNSSNIVPQPLQDSQQREGETPLVFVQPAQNHQEMDFIGDKESSRSSRRKLAHPQNLNERIENALNPLVGFINERPFDDAMDLGSNHIFDFETIRPEFIQALDYDPDQDMIFEEHHDEQRDFNQIFNEVLEGNENQPNYADPSLVVEEEVIVETEQSVVPPVFVKTPINYSQGPEPLLSPIAKNLEFRKEQVISSLERIQSPYASRSRNQSFTIPKKNSTSEKYEDKTRRTDHKERLDNRYDERSSKNSSSSRRSRSSEDRRQRDREKENEREKGTEKFTSREREKGKNTHTSTHNSSKHHHRSSEAHHSSHVQSDRESTSSSSSRATVPDKKEDKERKRKEREQKEAEQEIEERQKKRKEKAQREAEMEREQRQKEKERSKTATGTSLSKQQQANDFLNKVRNAHAAAKHSEQNSLQQSTGSSSTQKRKADESVKREFKIPKKGSTFSLHTKSSHGGGSSSNEPSTSGASSKAGKSGSKNSTGELCEGDDRPNSTRFLKANSHIARTDTVTSILHNTDASYQEFQNGLVQRAARIASTKPSPAYSAECSGPITLSDVPVSSHPKGRSFAPMKGSMMVRKKDSSSSNSSPDTDPCLKSDGEIDTESSKSRSQSPEPAQTFDINKIGSLLDRIHKND